MISLLSRDDWSICCQGEVNSWVWDQVGLELCQVHIKSTIKPKGGSDGRNNLSNKSVEVGICWSLNIQVPAADVIDSLIINHESTVRMFQGGMCGKDRVIRLHYSCSNLK